MGLAAYGEPRFTKEMVGLLTLTEGGGYRIDPVLFNGLQTLFGPARSHGEDIEQKHFDIARSLQDRLEVALEHIILHFLRQTGHTHLCLAGGVFLNCVANQRLAGLREVSGLFIQPAAHDGGTAIGAAALSSIRLGGKPQLRCDSFFLGTTYDDAAIEATLRQAGSCWIWLDGASMVKAVVDRLEAGKTFAFYRGRMEFGPRALGNRSIIASPQSAATRTKLNELKEREQFRPLAPIVTAEAFHELFDGVPNRYMMITSTVRPEVRGRIPAVTHADGTARAQVVHQEHDAFLHAVLTEFGRRTGTPVLINTSLNVRGRPIDESPQDALASFYTSGLDCIMMGNFLIDRTVAGAMEIARELV